MRKLNLHVIHCADTPDDMDIGAKEITKWHTDPKPQGNGWSDNGYHFIIKKDGTIEIGRPLEKMGAHAKGYNRNSVGTCLVGRDSFTHAQYESLRTIDNFLRKVYNVETVGHCDITIGKTCPNFNVKKVLGV